MKRQIRRGAAVLAVAALGACSGDYSGEAANGGGGGPNPGGGGSFATERALFDARVQPTLDFCRTCHVPGGVAAEHEDGRLFLLSKDPAQDYALLRASWEALDRGVETNRILTKASNTDPQLHSGGGAWPKGSAPYNQMKALLGCWDSPESCAASLAGLGSGGPVVVAQPLLGNPGKHYFVNQLCDGAPDSTPIDWNQDPRRLLTQAGGLIDSEQYAVHFNDPYEICHTDTLFETQQRQNELRIAQGEKPIYSAKRDPATCGEWRKAVKRGHDWIALGPTNQPLMDNHASGSIQITNYTAEEWNSLWKLWGMDARPENYDAQLFERYGHSPTPDHLYNPYPIVDPARGIDERPLLTQAFGGTGRLPLGFGQGRKADGTYAGTLSLNCFSCHAGQIGSGEIAGRDGTGNPQSYGANSYGSFMGLPNTNTELGVLILDLGHIGLFPDTPFPAAGYLPLVNTTRGTNAADTEIEAIVIIRDFDTLNFQRPFLYPVHDSYGDQDPPAWWWLSNKTRYLWFGGHSTDSSRGNMYFGSVNDLSGDQVKENEGIFEDVHQWSLTVEAPSYPGPIDTALAEQGAILFHEKNLWADGKNADIPRPKGNGSCASCHGAYSPRYIHDTRFLPTPALAGMVGYTVPIEIVDTDPAQATGWSKEIREHVSTFWWSYPDAVEGYALPEEKSPLLELMDDFAILGISGADLADHLSRNLQDMGVLDPVGQVLGTVLGTALNPVPNLPLGEFAGRIKGACGFEEKTVGYVTPPLHGVWASAPYFHNGSVPDVWSVLDPDARPTMWRRVRSETPVHFNQFETRLSAYDHDKLGWKYEQMNCGDNGAGIPYYTCQPQFEAPETALWLTDTLLGGLLWPTWIVPPPVGAKGLEDRMIFNTNLYSKKNKGHEWTRALTEAERRALLEYLKTL